MKKLLILFFTFLVSFASFSQEEAEKGGITSADFDAVKKLTIKNPDKDTYVKQGNFILDNENPPYVFKFSDGIERRIYLYKILEATKMKDVGSLAIFTTPKDGKRIALCIPNPLAEKEVWGKYIDDLKDGEKAVMGFSSCIAFVLAKEFSGVALAAGDKKEDKYEYCFPADAKVKMADGTEKDIALVKTGDEVLSFNSLSEKSEMTKVEQVQIHSGKQFELVQITLTDPANALTASVNSTFSSISLEATANHPVMTAKGQSKMGNLSVGDEVIVFNPENQTFSAYKVFTTKINARKVGKVYNLHTDKDNYLINSVVVLEK